MIEGLEVPIRVKSPAISATLIRLINAHTLAHTHRHTRHTHTHKYIYKILNICINFEFKMQITIPRAENIHPSLHKEH